MAKQVQQISAIPNVHSIEYKKEGWRELTLKSDDGKELVTLTDLDNNNSVDIVAIDKPEGKSELWALTAKGKAELQKFNKAKDKEAFLKQFAPWRKTPQLTPNLSPRPPINGDLANILFHQQTITPNFTIGMMMAILPYCAITSQLPTEPGKVSIDIQHRSITNMSVDIEATPAKSGEGVDLALQLKSTNNPSDLAQKITIPAGTKISCPTQ